MIKFHKNKEDKDFKREASRHPMIAEQIAHACSRKKLMLWIFHRRKIDIQEAIP